MREGLIMSYINLQMHRFVGVKLKVKDFASEKVQTPHYE